MSDVKEIQKMLNELNVSEITNESVAEFEMNVDDCMRQLEHKLEMEMDKKRDLANKNALIQAQVSELWDRVDKARRRETDISYKVTAWAQHLSEQMKTMKMKKQQIGYTMDSSAILSNEISENIEKLTEKRDNVQMMRKEIDVRRHLHKHQLKTLKNDIDDQELQIRHWNAVSNDITAAIAKLKEKKINLMARVEEEMKQEMGQKRMLEELEASLKKSVLNNRRKRDAKDGYKQCGRFATSFSALTEDSTDTS